MNRAPKSGHFRVHFLGHGSIKGVFHLLRRLPVFRTLSNLSGGKIEYDNDSKN